MCCVSQHCAYPFTSHCGQTPSPGIFPAKKRIGVKLLVLVRDPGSSVAITNTSSLTFYLNNPISIAEVKRFLRWCITRTFLFLDCPEASFSTVTELTAGAVFPKQQFVCQMCSAQAQRWFSMAPNPPDLALNPWLCYSCFGHCQNQL